MSRSLKIIQTNLRHDSSHEPVSCHVHFEHWNSADAHAKLVCDIDVAFTNTKALWDGASADIAKEIVDACKAHVNSASYLESASGAGDGPYTSETWDN